MDLASRVVGGVWSVVVGLEEGGEMKDIEYLIQERCKQLTRDTVVMLQRCNMERMRLLLEATMLIGALIGMEQGE